MDIHSLFISCAEGLEPLLLKELEEIGIRNLRLTRHGVYAPLSIQNVYRINYLSRLATRVLWPLRSFACRSREDLYAEASDIDWTLFMTLTETFAIDSNVFETPMLKHSLFAGLVVKDAICDVFREKTGERPSVDTASPNVQLHLFIHRNKAVLSFDTSGMPLHRRGYRTQSTIAPIQETLAAAILKLANYSWKDTLYDPCCGSGTFLIEAALMATQTPPGYLRKSWGFTRLPEHSQTLWESVKQQADEKILPLSKGQIAGSDADAKAVEAAKLHCEKAGFGNTIEIECLPAEKVVPKYPISLLLSNPPYGKRLPFSETLYKALKTIPAKRRFFLFPEKTMTGAHPLKNGGESVFLCELSS